MIDFTQKRIEAFARNYISKHCLIDEAKIRKVTIEESDERELWKATVEAPYRSGGTSIWLMIGVDNANLVVTEREGGE